ncbi:unnamed protein product [Chrysodeixis includens]|uniref:Uncharacterized protein n=1 Tax=Chrysodeixis includens TaxID=689277 RepID=A0A9N8L4B9_CHRIL|nr:unnamed protein product [Chrysodeixis includens]
MHLSEIGSGLHLGLQVTMELISQVQVCSQPMCHFEPTGCVSFPYRHTSNFFFKLSPLPVAQAMMEQHSSTGDSKHRGSLSRRPRRMYGCLQRGEQSNIPPAIHSQVSSQPRSIRSPILKLTSFSLHVSISSDPRSAVISG